MRLTVKHCAAESGSYVYAERFEQQRTPMQIIFDETRINEKELVSFPNRKSPIDSS